jgi:hypothetical protein
MGGLAFFEGPVISLEVFAFPAGPALLFPGESTRQGPAKRIGRPLWAIRQRIVKSFFWPEVIFFLDQTRFSKYKIQPVL